VCKFKKKEHCTTERNPAILKSKMFAFGSMACSFISFSAYYSSAQHSSSEGENVDLSEESLEQMLCVTIGIAVITGELQRFDQVNIF
jgi:hypothetical protein